MEKHELESIAKRQRQNIKKPQLIYMEELNMKFQICFAILLLFIPGRGFSLECNLKNFNLSKLDIEVSDKDFLEMVMVFSYGPNVKKFIPNLNLVISNFYYKESKDLPLMTFLTAKYKTEKTANEAFVHLKSKWEGNPNNQYDVIKVGKDITWLGNNRLDKDCFLNLSKTIKTSLSKI